MIKLQKIHTFAGALCYTLECQRMMPATVAAVLLKGNFLCLCEQATVSLSKLPLVRSHLRLPWGIPRAGWIRTAKPIRP